VKKSLENRIKGWLPKEANFPKTPTKIGFQMRMSAEEWYRRHRIWFLLPMAILLLVFLIAGLYGLLTYRYTEDFWFQQGWGGAYLGWFIAGVIGLIIIGVFDRSPKLREKIRSFFLNQQRTS